MRLLAAWIVPFWILLELVPTKLPHYVLPLFPALALAAARAGFALSDDGMGQPGRRFRFVFPALWTVVGLGFGIGLFLLPLGLGFGPMAGGAVAAAGAAVVGWHSLVSERARLGPASVLVAVVAALLVFVPALGLVLPRLDPIWLSRSAARLLAGERQPGEGLAVAGYAEPSLVFLAGTGTRLVVASEAAKALARHEVALTLVEDADDAAFHAALAARHVVPDPVGSVDGFNYSNGRWQVLRLYRLGTSAE
jgi:4-amino-4-deoxy-L-arabinose transferase-like glycosyltransferase